MLQFISRNKLIISIIGLGAILRLSILPALNDFAGDELFSFIYSQRPWKESWLLWLWETNPPLHMIMLKFWFYIFPANEFWIRVPSVIFGIITLVFFYRFLKKISTEQTAVIGTFLLAISPNHLIFSEMGRGYGLLVLLSTLSIDFFYDLYWTPSNVTLPKKIYFSIINLLILFTHLTAWVMLFSQALILFILKRGKLWDWLKINSLPIVTVGIWTFLSFYLKSWQSMDRAWFFNLRSGPIAYMSEFTSLLAGTVWWTYAIFIAYIFIIGFCIVIAKELKLKSLKYFPIVLIFLVQLIVCAIFKTWQLKFFIIILPAALAITSIMLMEMKLKKIYLFTLITFLLIPGLQMALIRLPIHSWDKINKMTTEFSTPNKKQVIIANTFITRMLADYYLKQPIPFLMYDAGELSGSKLDEATIRRNYIHSVYSEENMDAWIKKTNLNQYDEIFILIESGGGDKLASKLLKEGWKNDETKKDLIIAMYVKLRYFKR